MTMRYPTTPDGRYFLVRGRLWRMSDPALDPATRDRLVHELMDARRAKGAALKRGEHETVEAAKQAVDEAKRALGERGPVWWDDGAPDENRKLAKNSSYADWAAGLDGDGK